MVNIIKLAENLQGFSILKAWNKPNKINLKNVQKTVDLVYSMVYNEYVNKERELQKSSSMVN